GGYVHWGATTQNVTQTGQLLQVRRAHEIFLRQLGTLLGTLADLADQTKDVLLPGRTHGQHAVPATFGFKVAVWIDALGRHVDRLRGASRACSWPCWGAARAPSPPSATSGSARRSEWPPTSAWNPCPCPPVPSAITRRSTSCSSACSRPRAARSDA